MRNQGTVVRVNPNPKLNPNPNPDPSPNPKLNPNPNPDPSPNPNPKVVGAVVTGAALLFPLFYLKFGLLPDLVFSAVFGGGPAGLLALRTDAVGKFARDAVGGTTNLALSNFVIQAEEIDNEYKVTKEAQERIRRQIDQLSELRGKVDEQEKSRRR